jgi:hypothetical protein
MSASSIRDTIAELGPQCVAWVADIPACFRRQNINERLLPLFVYAELDKAGILQWFLDLANPFGWATSEWGWQCLLAIIKWELRRRGLEDTMAYVDNFFDLSLPDVSESRKAALESVFKDAGIDLHEVFTGKEFPGLGWNWDISKMTMTCPLDKHNIFNGYLVKWKSAKTLTLLDTERAVGLMSWGSAGLPMLSACVAPLIHMRSKLKRWAKETKSSASLTLKVSKDARVALDFAHEIYSEWNRESPIVQGFGPTAMWDSLGRCDASPTGCGGFLVDATSLRAFMHKWTQAEKDRAKVNECMSTTVLELMGAIHWASNFGPLTGASRVQLEMDCLPAVVDIQKAYSEKVAVMGCVSEFRLACARANMHLRTRHVLGEVYNRIADALSRDNLGQACRDAQEEFGLPLTLVPC